MTRATRLWSTSASVALLAAVVGCGGGDGGDLRTSVGKSGSGLASSGRVPLYWGEPRIANYGDKPVTLRSARPTRAEGMRVRRVLVAGPDRSFPDFGVFPADLIGPRFHRERWRPLAGYRVPPRRSLRTFHKDVEVVFELEPVRPGATGRIEGVTIEYDGGTLKAPDTLVVCAPRTCRVPEE